jgi:DNA-directed RNA polymerase I subunit RPA2
MKTNNTTYNYVCNQPTDQSSKTLSMHYLTTGSLNIRFSIRKQEFFIPVILLLKALYPTQLTDKYIYTSIVDGHHSSNFLTDRVELLLVDGHRTGFTTRQQILAHLGTTFRVLLRPQTSMTDEAVGQMLLDDHIMVHCYHSSNHAINSIQKFHTLVHMIQKTYALAEGRIKADNPDALNNQEVLLPGHLYLMILKEKLSVSLVSCLLVL